MPDPILVIGALGNVGAETVKQIMAQGGSIRAADLDVNKIRARFGDAVQAVRFDFTDPTTYPEAFAGAEKMFLLRPPHITNIQRDMKPALQAARQAGVRQVVFLSLIGIEQARFIPHYKVETCLKELGFETTFLRCSFFMQNLNTTHRLEIRDRGEIFIPVGKAKTSFIDVRDIGAVAAAALTRPGHENKNYDLTGSESLDYWQTAKILSDVLGRDITYRNPNPVHFLVEILRRGTPFMFAVIMLGLYTSTRFGMAQAVTPEVEKILGRSPITFWQYANDYKDAWISR
jgi:uncharacterized protein YbjT (DUF2867 family)